MHTDNGEFFTHWQSGLVEFDSIRMCRKFNLINAFNKKFAFMYISSPKSMNVVFIIYLLGRKLDAQKFMVDFELRNDMRKLKQIEMCYSDADNIKEIINNHQCFVFSKKTSETYAKNGFLEFRFVIKKKCDIEAENFDKHQHKLNHILGIENSAQQLGQTNPMLQMKMHQIESDLILTAQQHDPNKSHRRVYKRKPKI